MSATATPWDGDERITAIRGPALSFSGDPFVLGLKRTLCFEADAILAMSRGRITHFGRAEVVRPQLGA
jgi:guanine deaminase